VGQGDKPSGIGAYAQKLVLAHLKVKKLEAELKMAKAEFSQAQSNAQDVFLAQGVSSIDYRGFTAFLHSQDFASLVKDEDGSEEAAFKALKKAKLGWMIKPKVNTNTLSSWVREQPEDEKTMERILPEDLKDHISIFRKQEVRIRKKP